MGRKSKKTGEKVNKLVQHNRRELAGLVTKVLQNTSILQHSLTPAKSWKHFLEVKNLLDQISNLEASLKFRHGPKRQTFMKEFLEWLKVNGAQFEGIEICEIEGYGLGLKATKDFEEGSLLLTVPRNLMMTDNDARESPLNDLIETDPLLQHMPNITLSLFLLLEKSKPDSFWKPYINILPDKYPTVLYYTTEELELLKPSAMLEASLKLCRNIARQYAYFYNKIHTMDLPVTKQLREVFSYDNYRWAVSSVMTRQNNIQLGNDDCTAFLPLWDMANHEKGKVTTCFNVEENRGECFALRDFKAGEQVFIYYGDRPNSDFFLHNGFVYPENEYDSMILALGVASSDPERARRSYLLVKLGLAVAQYQMFAGDRPISAELLAFIRIFSMCDEDLERWIGTSVPHELVSTDAAHVEAVGIDIDKKGYKYLKTRCELLLAAYKRQAVPEAKGDIHRTTVRLLKECEARILESGIKHLDIVLKKLEESPNDSAAILQTLKALPRESATLLQKIEETPEESANLLQKLKETPKESANLLQKLEEIPEESATLLQKLEETPKESATLLQKLEDIPKESANLLQKLEEIPEESATLLQKLEETPKE